jgi:hypothetical protein
VLGTVLWSHDRGSKQTRAVFIPRPRGNSVEDSNKVFHEFERTIELQKALIELPCFLQLVSGINLAEWLDTVIENEHTHIRQAESSTGWGMWANENDPSPPTTLNLNDMSKMMGTSATDLANALRHADLIADFLAAQELGQPLTTGPHATTQTSETEARELVEHLRARVAIRKRDVEYFLQRVNIQLTVV